MSIAQYKQLTSTVYIQDDFSGLEVTGTLKHRPHESILFLYQCFRFGSNMRWSTLPLRIGGDFVRRKVRRKGKRLCQRADWSSVSRPIEMRESTGQGRQTHETRQNN